MIHELPPRRIVARFCKGCADAGRALAALILTGPRWWAKLHLRALAVAGPDEEWLAQFGKRLPCGSCRRHWREYVQLNPPRWDDYFAWTVEAHNAVNQRLGKPVMSLEAARNVWTTRAKN